jgi:hypothetical protein
VILPFSWKNFNCSTFTVWKRQKATDANDAHEASSCPNKITTATPSTILDFSDDVMEKDAERMASRATPGSTATLTPHPLWISPFATMVRKHVSTRTFDDTDLALLSDDPTAIVTFYRHLVQLAKSAEIDLCPIHLFDSAHYLWPIKRCAETIFEMKDLLVIKLSKDGVLNLENATLNLFYTTSVLENDIQIKAYTFLHKLLD